MATDSDHDRPPVSAIIGNPAALPSGHGKPAEVGAAPTGQPGGLRTARVLDRLASGNGATILHGLALPAAPAVAAIDHAVVSGRDITVIDSRRLAPGFYWTRGGNLRRGRTRVAGEGLASVLRARDALRRHLDAHGLPAVRLRRPVIVVWPTDYDTALSVWAVRPDGARVLSGTVFAHRAARLCGTSPADAVLVDALRGLVVAAGSSGPAGGAPTS